MQARFLSRARHDLPAIFRGGKLVKLSARGNMPAYLIVQHTIRDAEKLEEYRIKVTPVLAKYGARFVTKAGSHKLLAGAGPLPERMAIVKFQDIATLNAWYNSSEYRPLIALRQSAVDPSSEVLITLEGA